MTFDPNLGSQWSGGVIEKRWYSPRSRWRHRLSFNSEQILRKWHVGWIKEAVNLPCEALCGRQQRKQEVRHAKEKKAKTEQRERWNKGGWCHASSTKQPLMIMGFKQWLEHNASKKRLRLLLFLGRCLPPRYVILRNEALHEELFLEPAKRQQSLNQENKLHIQKGNAVTMTICGYTRKTLHLPIS